MDYKLSSIKITGHPGDGGWAQIHEFRPEESMKLKNRGHLFAVFATKTFEEGVDRVFQGRELLTRLHEEYFGENTKTAFNALKDAVNKVASEFKNLWGNVEISASSIVGDVVYTAASGGAKTFIFRQGMLATILESKKDGFVCASGFPQKEDILILATEKFNQVVAKGSLQAALEKKELDAIQEMIAATIHTGDQSGDLGVVLISFSHEKKNFIKNLKVFKKNNRNEKNQETQAKLKSGNIFSKFIKKLPERKIYIREEIGEKEKEHKRKLAVSIGIILLILLIISIFFGIEQKNKNEERARYQEILSQAQHEYDEAIEIYTLNPQRARELINESRLKIEKLEQEKIKDEEFEKLKGGLESSVEKILGEYNLAAELFLDLTLLTDRFKGDIITSFDENLYILDKTSKKIVSIAIATKRSEVVSGPSQIENPKNLTAYANKVYLSETEGIFEIGEKKIKKVDKDWGDDYLIYAYAGNIYLLDKEKNEILRFAGSQDSFSAKKSWLTPGSELDFSNIISWTIDGSVWLISGGGKIERFSLGNKINFNVSGLYPELVSAKAIYSNEELKYLYILDPEKRRVVVLTKEGEYKAQYYSEEIGNALIFQFQRKIKR
ncbi:hypothetical protein A2Z22_02785 [Candidatus Woesebacteria bacterium RBG_16_34_12]|uniref:PPM-type phosphatase domain-containing protein n=1 Tax=Candidatus Woesebacteria bacterium RBG_16_34_12 TaxID=1802480 RepID=A0A1F7X6Y3_9BACT|nr:MAG: hypothetical protein A2Z22_02785 [Candidatus Woesebacteria bacterium RBG_16_34_12]